MADEAEVTTEAATTDTAADTTTTAAAGATSTDAGVTAGAETTTAGADTATTTTDASTAAVEAAKAYWPGDWKDKVVGEAKDDPFAKWVARYGSVEAALKGGFEAVNRVRSGEYKKALTDGAKPEDVAEWRTANGVPEKPDDYKIAVPDDLAPDDATKKLFQAEIDAYRPVFHELNLSQKQAEAMTAFYFADQKAVQQAKFQAAQQAMEKSKLDLAREYGRNYEPYMKMSGTFVAEQVGKDGADRLFNTVLADGTHLGSHPDFIRLATNAALAFAGDGEVITGDSASGGSLQEQYDKAIALRGTDMKKYGSPEHQALVDRLANQLLKQANKAA